jgi:hypothetical protein
VSEFTLSDHPANRSGEFFVISFKRHAENKQCQPQKVFCNGIDGPLRELSGQHTQQSK